MNITLEWLLSTLNRKQLRAICEEFYIKSSPTNRVTRERIARDCSLSIDMIPGKLEWKITILPPLGTFIKKDVDRIVSSVVDKLSYPSPWMALVTPQTFPKRIKK